MTRRFFLFLSLLIVVACQTRPPMPVQTDRPEIQQPPPLMPAATPAAFIDLPGWETADLGAAIKAFRRSCALLRDRPVSRPLSDNVAWAGTVGDWSGACASLEAPLDREGTKRVVESLFTPIEIIDPEGKGRFTGYFEPVYEARYFPEPGFTEPVPALPEDFIANGSRPLQRLTGGGVRPYPERAAITVSPVQAIAWAHPADVFFLQIQGSGRLRFPDGKTLRAAYAANNGHEFRSVANWLIQTGRIRREEASMQGIRAWMNKVSAQEMRAAMNVNPRFVFFRALPEGDPGLGPSGAQNVPLTPLGSMAVDPSYHALGVPIFVETNAPGLGGKWSGMLISQDTGGAITGPVRGDIYFGTGEDAGRRAGTMNAPGRLWVLLPRVVARRLAP